MKNESQNSRKINVNSAVLHFIASNNSENTFRKQQIATKTSLHTSKIVNLDSLSGDRLTTPFWNFLNERTLINTFQCENDSTLAAGEYSFLIYGGQYLTLFNIDGQLHKTSWKTNIYDSIKQIRWSSYHRSYLIMTARIFYLFTLFSYELFPVRNSFQINEQFQLFTCHQTDIWLVCLLSPTTKQILVHYNLSEWERRDAETKNFSLDRLGLYTTDTICALENDQNGEYLALLIAERNQNLTVGIQRRRRLVILEIYNMSPIRTIYFSGGDDPYWTLTSVISRHGWLLGKWLDNQLTFLDNKCNHKMTCMEYKKVIRNLAVTIDGHYLVLRTVNSLDIYQID